MRPLRLGFCHLAAALALGPGTAPAQSEWDDLLSNSEWYVPAENLLAYMTSPTSFANPIPIADQTLWEIGTCTDGMFTGTSNATLKSGSFESTSTASMNGLVTPSGQVRIQFTQEGGPTVIGVGQMRNVEGVDYVEMQMITGGGSGPFVTHWAYMAEYEGQELPPLEIDGGLRSQEWIWMKGTDWSLATPPSLGLGGPASFHVDNYLNGYFWGSGTSPNGDFTLIGSATPEGNILYNFLLDGELVTLSGQITGNAENGAMALRNYTSLDDIGQIATAQVVPEPGVVGLLVLAAPGIFCLMNYRSRRAFRIREGLRPA